MSKSHTLKHKHISSTQGTQSFYMSKQARKGTAANKHSTKPPGLVMIKHLGIREGKWPASAAFLCQPVTGGAQDAGKSIFLPLPPQSPC